MSTGLKNRGKTREDVDDRRKAVEAFTGARLDSIGSYGFDPLAAEKNVENMIGSVQVPVGFVGPLKVNGEDAVGEFLVPLATTEGALVASVNRGCSALTAAGGANVYVIKDEMTRAPVFRVRDLKHCLEVTRWVEEHLGDLRREAESTTRHGKLLKIDPFAVGRSLFLRMHFSTGDAMGMNMATIAAEAVSRLVEQETGATLVSVSGNLCVDKKPAAMNYILGRGKMVLADALVPRAVIEERMRADPTLVVEACYRKNQIGSALAGTLGGNAHVANMLAAMYIATGQDPAQVVEGSMGTTACELVDGDLYISLRLPALEVGTVGGGTRLPGQAEALSMIGCTGAGKARKLAEIMTAVALAGELSTLCAQATGTLGSAHKALGR